MRMQWSKRYRCNADKLVTSWCWNGFGRKVETEENRKIFYWQVYCIVMHHQEIQGNTLSPEWPNVSQGSSDPLCVSNLLKCLISGGGWDAFVVCHVNCIFKHYVRLLHSKFSSGTSTFFLAPIICPPLLPKVSNDTPIVHQTYIINEHNSSNLSLARRYFREKKEIPRRFNIYTLRVM